LGLSALGAVACMSFTASRIILDSARDGYFPNPLGALLSRVTVKWNTPAWAVMFHWLVTVVYILSAPPQDAYAFLIEAMGFAAWAFYLLTIVGVVRMRWTLPDMSRPFRAPWVVTIAFLMSALFVVAWSFVPPLRASDRVSRNGIPFYVPALVGIGVIAFTVVLWYLQIIVGRGMENSEYGRARQLAGDDAWDDVMDDVKRANGDGDKDALWASEKGLQARY